MGAGIRISCLKGRGFEPMGSLTAVFSRLKATTINPNEIPSLIDELPVLMVAACFAKGRSIIKGAGELKVKETDRINSMVSNLKSMGADIKVKSGESIVIEGGDRLRGASLKSFADHRTAMSLVVAALAAEGESRIDDIGCINKSFPGFLNILNYLSKS